VLGERDITVDGTEVLLTGLSKCHKYVVRVVAYNVNGPGPATDELTCCTFSDGKFCTFDFKSLFTGGGVKVIISHAIYLLHFRL